MRTPKGWQSVGKWSFAGAMVLLGVAAGQLLDPARPWVSVLLMALLLLVSSLANRRAGQAGSEVCVIELQNTSGRRNKTSTSSLKPTAEALRSQFVLVTKYNTTVSASARDLSRSALRAEGVVDYCGREVGREDVPPSVAYTGRLTAVFAAASLRRESPSYEAGKQFLCWRGSNWKVASLVDIWRGQVSPLDERWLRVERPQILDVACAPDVAVAVDCLKEPTTLSSADPPEPYGRVETRWLVARAGVIGSELPALCERVARVVLEARDASPKARLHLFLACPDVMAAYLGLRLGFHLENRAVLLYELDSQEGGQAKYVPWVLPNSAWDPCSTVEMQ